QRLLRGMVAQRSLQERALALGRRAVHAARGAAALAGLPVRAESGGGRHRSASAVRDLDVLLFAVRHNAVNRSATGADAETDGDLLAADARVFRPAVQLAVGHGVVLVLL